MQSFIPTFFTGYTRLSQDDNPLLPRHSGDIALRELGSHADDEPAPDSAPTSAQHGENNVRSRSVGQFIRKRVFGGGTGESGKQAAPEVRDWVAMNNLLLEVFREALSPEEQSPGNEYLDENGEQYADPEVEALMEMLEVKDGQRNWAKSLGKFGETCADVAFGSTIVAGVYAFMEEVISANVAPESQGMTKAFLMGSTVGAPAALELKAFYTGVKEAFFYKEHSLYNGAEALRQLYFKRIAENIGALKDLPRDKMKAFAVSHINIKKNIEQAMPAAPGQAVGRDALSMAGRIMAWQKTFIIGRKYEEPREVKDWKSDAGRATLMRKQERLMLYTPQDAKIKLVSQNMGILLRSVKVEIPQAMLDNLDPAIDFSDKLRLWSLDEDWHVWNEVPDLSKPIPALLVGLPGTGKTHHVTSTIPELMNLYASDMMVPTKKKGGFEAMGSDEWPAMEQDQFVTSPKQLVGQPNLKKVQKQYSNAPMLFDEADLQDVDGLKRFSDPSMKKRHSGCLDIDFEYTEPTYYAVNHIPKEAAAEDDLIESHELAGALDDRLVTISFRFSYAELKRITAVNVYRALAAHACLPIAGSDDPVLDPDRQARLQTLFKSVLDKLVDLDTDAVPGDRMHIPVEMLFTYMLYRLLGEKHLTQPLLTAEEVSDYVDVHYAGKRKRNPYAAEAKQDPRAQPDWRTYLRGRAKKKQDTLAVPVVKLTPPPASPSSQRSEAMSALPDPSSFEIA